MYSWKGRGTGEEPYVISTNDELEELADYVNTGGTCEGLSICLGGNLNWNNGKWPVIGSRHNRFAGIFDGKNFEISGLALPSGKDDCGFFGCLDAKAVVKNLKIKAKASVCMSQNSSIGFLVGTNYGTVENCHVSGTLTITQDLGTQLIAGLLVGRNQGGAKISKCSADGTVNGKQGAGREIISGLAGQNAAGAVLEECVLKGSVTGFGSMAGICNKNEGELKQCQNLAHMQMDVQQFPVSMYVISPEYRTGDAVSGGIYEVSVGKEPQITLLLGKEKAEEKTIVDIIVTPETPLHIGKDDVASYRKVTLLNGGYIVIEDSASLDIAELYKAVSKQEGEQKSDMEVIPHWDPRVALKRGGDIIVRPSAASANMTIAIGCLYSDLTVDDENECYIRCKTDAENAKDTLSKGNNIVEIKVEWI